MITSRFPKYRKWIPLALLAGSAIIVTLFALLSSVLTSTFQLGNSNGLESEWIERRFDFFFLVVFMLCFLSLFLPLLVPMARVETALGQMDVVLQTPLRLRDFVLGLFFANLTIIVPVVVTFETAVLLVIRLQTGSVPLLAAFVTFCLLFLLSAMGLLVGVFVATVMLRLELGGGRVLGNLLFGSACLFLLFVADQTIKHGYQHVQDQLYFKLSPIGWVTVAIAEVLFSVRLSLTFQDSILLLLVGSAFLLAGLLLFSNRIELEAQKNARSSSFAFPLPQVIPLRFRILNNRFFRDAESLSRIFLALSFSVVLLYLLTSGLLPTNTIDDPDQREMIEDFMVFFALISCSATMVYIEASYFSIDSMEILPTLLSIPNGPKILAREKLRHSWGMLLPISALVIVIALFLKADLPYSPIIMWILLYGLSVGLTGIVIGIALINPISDEEDLTNLANSVAFFAMIALIEILFLLTRATFGGGSKSLFRGLVAVLFQITVVIVLGLVIFRWGAENFEGFDLGEGTGPYTVRFRILGLFGAMFVLCWVFPPFVVFAFLAISREPILLGFLFYGASLLPLLLVTRQTWWKDFRGTPNTIRPLLLIFSIFGGVLLALGWLLGIGLITMMGIKLLPPNSFTTISKPRLTPMLLILGSLFLILGVLTEELFFRKFALELLNPAFSRRKAAILSAIAFALMHISLSLISFLSALTLGIILAVLYLKTRNLMYPVLLHLFYNLVLIALFFL